MKRLAPAVLLVVATATCAHASMSEDFQKAGLIALIAVIVVGLVLREVVCWYFKINERIALLEDIRQKIAQRPNAAPEAEVVSKKAKVATENVSRGYGAEPDPDI